MKKIIILSLLFLGFTVCNYSFAEKNEVFDFVKDYIQCLQYLKINYEKSIELEQKKFENVTDQTLEIMTDSRLAEKKLQMAQSLIEKYSNSQNNFVKESATGILLALDIQRNAALKTIKLLEKINSPEAINNPDKFDQGAYLSKLSELMANSEDSWQLLMQVSILVTYTMVDQNPDKEGHLAYLVLTSEERQELINDLGLIYGDNIKNGPQAGQTKLDACGAILQQILSGDHKSAEKRIK